MKFAAKSLGVFVSAALLALDTSCAFAPAPSITSPSTSQSATDTKRRSILPKASHLFAEPNGKSGGLSFGNAKSILNDAFANLSQSDQYDAVLTGLCAKILDEDQKPPPAPVAIAPENLEEVTGEAQTIDPVSAEKAEEAARLAAMSPSERAFTILSDPLSLLEEMNGRRVKASPRSLSALIDAAATTDSPSAMSSVMSLGMQNGGISNFGCLQSFINAIPTNPNTRIVCPDGVRRTRDQRLEILPPVPLDDRATEVTSALALSALLSICLIIRSFGGLFDLEDLQGPADFIIGSSLFVGFVDNFYDAVKGLTGFVAKTQQDKIPDAVKNANVGLPDKESVPLGIGQGKITGTVVRGLTRLLSVDTERECECEAAAFFAAYALGLPVFAFRPNALEGAVLVFESAENDDYSKAVLDSLLSDIGVLKVLIWIMSPVAAESGKHAQLIASDPREGMGLLRRLRERAQTISPEVADAIDDILGSGTEEEMDVLLRWSYAEADALLRDNRKVVEELTERLAGGAATIGDCAAVLEGW